MCLVNGALGRVGWKRLPAFRDRLDHLWRREILDQFARVHAKRAKRSEASFEIVIVDFLRMKLLIDPLFDADRRDSLDVAGSWTKGQAIERVQRPFLLIHLNRRRIAFIAFIFLRDGELAGEVKPDAACGHKNYGLSSQKIHGTRQAETGLLIIINTGRGKVAYR